VSIYKVIVGNIGTVHTTNNPIDANRVYGIYKKQSQSEVGRAGGEDVTIFKDDEPVLEFIGSLNSTGEDFS